MQRDDAPPLQFSLPPEQVALALAQIEGSLAFRNAHRHRKLLRHLVERSLAGDHAALKESVLAVEVFGRSASAFDPRADSIVRVEARRLRQRLNNYFRGEGQDVALRIELPIGSYVPSIGAHAEPPRALQGTRRARDLAERGEYFLRQPLSRATLEAARERFDEALRESPEFAPAWAGLGRAWLNLATGWYHDPGPAAEHAAEALQRALALDADDAVAHALLGAIAHQFEGDWPAAQRHFKRAAELAPQLAFVHSAWGCHLIYRKLPLQAERELLLARSLDPQYINARVHMVNLRLLQRRFDAAQAEMDAVRDMAPDSMQVAGTAGVIALARGDAAAAVRHFERTCELGPDHPNAWVCLAYAQAAAGRVAEADATIDRLRRRPGLPPASPYTLAILAAHSGRADQAFDLLQRCLRERDPNAMMMAADTSLGPLHGDTRWPALVVAARRPRRLL